MNDGNDRRAGGRAVPAGASNGCDRPAIHRQFELRGAFTVPSRHWEIERLIAAGQHAEAAQAIGELQLSARQEPRRAALAQAICWMR